VCAPTASSCGGFSAAAAFIGGGLVGAIDARRFRSLPLAVMLTLSVPLQPTSSVSTAHAIAWPAATLNTYKDF
jgi:hypothetical protein